MVGVSTKTWALLEKWTAGIFLLSGLLLLIGTVVVGLQLVTGDPTFLKNPFELAPYLGFIVSYFGLLGLYPRLSGHIPFAKISLLLLLLPVMVMLIYIASAVIGTELPFAGTVSIGAFLLFALGIAQFGIGSYQTDTPARGVGISLLAVAAAWFLLLGVGLIIGFPAPQPVVFVTAAIMTVAFLAIGRILRTQRAPGERTKPAADTSP